MKEDRPLEFFAQNNREPMHTSTVKRDVNKSTVQSTSINTTAGADNQVLTNTISKVSVNKPLFPVTA